MLKFNTLRKRVTGKVKRRIRNPFERLEQCFVHGEEEVMYLLDRGSRRLMRNSRNIHRVSTSTLSSSIDSRRLLHDHGGHAQIKGVAVSSPILPRWDAHFRPSTARSSRSLDSITTIIKFLSEHGGRFSIPTSSGSMGLITAANSLITRTSLELATAPVVAESFRLEGVVEDEIEDESEDESGTLFMHSIVQLIESIESGPVSGLHLMVEERYGSSDIVNDRNTDQAQPQHQALQSADFQEHIIALQPGLEVVCDTTMDLQDILDEIFDSVHDTQRVDLQHEPPQSAEVDQDISGSQISLGNACNTYTALQDSADAELDSTQWAGGLLQDLYDICGESPTQIIAIDDDSSFTNSIPQSTASASQGPSGNLESPKSKEGASIVISKGNTEAIQEPPYTPTRRPGRRSSFNSAEWADDLLQSLDSIHVCDTTQVTAESSEGPGEGYARYVESLNPQVRDSLLVGAGDGARSRKRDGFMAM